VENIIIKNFVFENCTINHLNLIEITQSANINLTNISINNNEFNQASRLVSENKNIFLLINDTKNLEINNIIFENNTMMNTKVVNRLLNTVET
jgi:hypothetical protein